VITEERVRIRRQDVGVPAPGRGPRHLRRPPPRRVAGTLRHAVPAGKILAAMLVCFLVWSLLAAKTLKRASEGSEFGARRSASLAVLGPLERLSDFLFADRLADALASALGRDVDGRGAAVVPPLPPLPDTDPGPPLPHRTNRPHGDRGPGGQGQGDRPKGNGEGKGDAKGDGKGPGKGPGRGEGDGKTRPGGTTGPRPEDAPDIPEPPAQPTGPPLRKPTGARPLRVLVVGDSFAQEIQIGLSRFLDSNVVDLQQRGVHSTGLARPDYFNWHVQIRADAEQYRPDVVVVMLGANDPQPLRSWDASLVSEEDSAQWAPLYRQRVGQFMDEASEYGARVLWVGLPIMAISEYSASIERQNTLYEREAGDHRRVVYLDTWDLFSNKPGEYTPFLREGDGDLIPIRDGDGIHLTTEGNGILAEAAIDVLRETWKLPRTAIRG
jgi:hypothetical protein